MTDAYYGFKWMGAALAALVLAGCANPEPYHAQTSPHSTGYTDERLGDNRYRVTYRGSSATGRAAVENYLLLRSAEVTLQSGFGFFVFDTRDTEAKTSYRTDFVGWPGWAGRGAYWHSWDFGGPTETIPVTHYDAYAEIVMLNPEQAKIEPRAIRAQDVIDRIGPKAP